MHRHAIFFENPFKRLVSALTVRDVLICVLCYMLSRAAIFDSITPFGIAFFAVSFSNIGWFYALICSAIGVLTVHTGMDSLRYIITLGFSTAVLGLTDAGHKRLFKALTVSLIYFAVCFFMQTAYGFKLYEFIVQSFEAFLCFVSVFAIASVVPVITSYKKRNYLSHGEIVGIITIAAMVIISFTSLPPLFGINLSSCMALFLIMAVSYRGDIMISSCAGIIFGIALALSRNASAAIVGAYAVVGFSAGFFSRYSRLCTVLGVTLANAVMIAFMPDTGGVLINPVEVFVIGMVFAMLPKKTAAVFTDFAGKAAETGRLFSSCEKQSDSAFGEKLYDTSLAFGRIADVYRRDCFLRKPGKQYMTRLFDYICEKSCNGCDRHFECWIKRKQNTLACLNSMITKAEETGFCTVELLPGYFRENCINHTELIKAFDSVYNIYKTDRMWLDKMYETRMLMVNQLEGVSDILDSISTGEGWSRNREYEINLRSALDIHEISFEKVCVFVNESRLMRIRIISEEADTEVLLDVCEDVFDMKLCLCSAFSRDELFCCEICPAGEYIIDSASVYACREGETVCGDSFGTFNIDGRTVMIISDGMGSGVQAGIQSKDTVDMLGSYLEAGFDAGITFELVNSSLLLRSMKDCFSTIDMMCADTDSGEVTFSKIGAAPSYIKQDGSVRCIDCTSLPVGILREIDAETTTVQISDHAIIVMMSDGISNSEIKNGESWISDELARLDTHNPAVVAEKILEKAIAKNGGRTEDDMTVAVAVVYKNEYKGKNYIY